MLIKILYSSVPSVLGTSSCIKLKFSLRSFKLKDDDRVISVINVIVLVMCYLQTKNQDMLMLAKVKNNCIIQLFSQREFFLKM